MKYIPRNLCQKLQRAALDSPVLLLNGARQVGKSTLMQHLLEPMQEPAYYTFDDLTTLAAAQAAPQSFVQNLPDRCVLDEIQRVPELFISLKQEVDRKRLPGRFLITGSANVLLLPNLSDSLAGRMDPRTLWPLSKGEILGRSESFIDWAFSDEKAPLFTQKESTEAALMESVLLGGYPEALSRTHEDSRNAWFRAYLNTILQRDVRDLSNIEQLTALPDLLSVIASRPAAQLNAAELGRSLKLPNTTLRRYLALLETVFLVNPLRAWSSNLSKRLVKAPKLILTDTGLLCHLLNANSQSLTQNRTLFGGILENFVAMEIIKQLGWAKVRANLYHFRTLNGQEVDLLLEAPDGRVVGIEVKSASDVKTDAFKGLKVLKDEVGKRFSRGIVLYTGSTTVSFGQDLSAMPVSSLWNTQSLIRGFSVSGFRLGMSESEIMLQVKQLNLSQPKSKRASRPSLIKILAFTPMTLIEEIEWTPEFFLLKKEDEFLMYSAQGRLTNSDSKKALAAFTNQFGPPDSRDELGFRWLWGGSTFWLGEDDHVSFFHDELNQDWHHAAAQSRT